MHIFRRRPKTSPANLDQSLVLHLSKSRIPNPRQLKYVGRFLSSTERIILTVCLLIGLGGLIFLGILFYRNNIEAYPGNGGTYTEGIIGSPQYINPLYSSLNDADADLDQLLFSRLFSRDANGQPKNDLADTVTISEDTKTYTITLKQAYWTNGEPVTADDVVFTLGLIQDAENRSPLKNKYAGLTAAATDDRTVSFTLREPAYNFLSELNFGILPQSAWDGVSAQTITLAELNTKPISSGPFKFKSLTKNKNGTIRSYIVERNNGYYGQKPYLDEIIFKFFPSAEEMIGAFNNGQINGLSYLDKDIADLIIAKNSLEYNNPALPELTALFFNLKSKNVIADKSLRQALSLAIDQESIVADNMERWVRASHTLLPANIAGNKDAFMQNTNRANELLDRLGWARNNDGRFKGDKQLTVSLIVPDSLKEAGERIARAWQTIGVKTELTTHTEEALEKDVIPGRKFDIVLYRITYTDNDPYPLWQTASDVNITGWTNKELDDLLASARTSTAEDAAKKYGRFLDLAADEVPAVPIFWKSYIYAQNKKIRGFSTAVITDPAERLVGAAEWYIKVRHRLKK